MNQATLTHISHTPMSIRVGDRFKYGMGGFVVTVIDLQFSYNFESGVSHTYVTFNLRNIGSNGTLEGHVVLDMIASGKLVPTVTTRDLLGHCVNCHTEDIDDDAWIETLHTVNVCGTTIIHFTDDGGVDEFEEIPGDPQWESLERVEVRCCYCHEPLTEQQMKAYEEMVS